MVLGSQEYNIQLSTSIDHLVLACILTCLSIEADSPLYSPNTPSFLKTVIPMVTNRFSTICWVCR